MLKFSQWPPDPSLVVQYCFWKPPSKNPGYAPGVCACVRVCVCVCVMCNVCACKREKGPGSVVDVRQHSEVAVEHRPVNQKVP